MINSVDQATYIGLDIESNSVGWAVTNSNYELIRFHGKDMWGVRLFDEAKNAAERRTCRAARRRLQRRNQRLELLQMLFADAVNAVDPAFFQRMEAARLLPEDKAWKYTLFQDNNYTDKHFYKQYPTIYHLRYALITQKGPFDVRLVYLACHHILKNRGHFLYADIDETGLPEIGNLLSQASQELCDLTDISLQCSDVDGLKKLLLSNDLKKSEKQKKITELFTVTENEINKMVCREWTSLLIGKKGNLSLMFSDDSLEYNEITDIDFSDASYDEHSAMVEETIGSDRMHLIELWRSIYNWAVLKNLLGDHHLLSEAKIALFQKNESDLKKLKQLVKKYGSKEQYDHIFRDTSVANNFAAYIGHTFAKGSKINLDRCTQVDFCRFITNEIKDYPPDDNVLYIRSMAENDRLFTRLVSMDNGFIPYQLHKQELVSILQNAEKYLPFLSQKDSNGMSTSEKILKILEFYVPYFVGPLNEKSKYSWFVRKTDGKILPWNFEEKIDIPASAQAFIDRMTRYCTYLPSCNVLPACSPLYERFCVLNEINPLTVKGEHIPPDVKQNLFDNIFMKFPKPGIPAILRILSSLGYPNPKKEDIGGMDVAGGIKSSLRTTRALMNILGDRYNIDLADRIVFALTYFGSDRKLLRSKLMEEECLTNNDIVQIMSRVKCSGWSRLSKEFLTDIRVPDASGNSTSILEALWETNEPLSVLLSDNYGYMDAIKAYNSENGFEWTEKSFIQELYLPPVVKRQINQAVTIVKELRKITGHDPDKVFIKVSHEKKEKGKKPVRKQILLDMYKSCKCQEPELYDLLENTPSEAFRRDRLYLYFTQMGKCMYTGEPIRIEDIYNDKLYNVDHIFPRSSVKDNSLDNRVLVKTTVNHEKSHIYPLSPEIRERMTGYWSILLKNKMISQRKYDRLIRPMGFTDDELAGFVSRQLIETRQSTKAVAELLHYLLPESEIVYVKDELVSDFRQDRDMLKARELNDLYHAKDAYLNIVVGNVYDTEFSHSPLDYIREHRNKYTVNEHELFARQIKRNSTIAWEPDDNGTIMTVRKVMKRNSPLVTVMPVVEHGALFNIQPLKKGNGQMRLKKDLPIERYGGYKNVAGACFMLVEHSQKRKRVRSIIDIPIYLMSQLSSKPEALESFCINDRGLKDPTVIIPNIKLNTLINLDGIHLYLRGRTNTRIVGDLGFQLMVDYNDECYIRHIYKYVQDADEYEHQYKGEVYKISLVDKISKEQNLELYNLIVNKLYNKPYSSLATYVSAAQNLDKDEVRSMFIEKTVEQQCRILKNMLFMFARKCRAIDLAALGMSKNVGLRRINRCLDTSSVAQLIYQSPTGLFEEIIDLKSIK